MSQTASQAGSDHGAESDNSVGTPLPVRPEDAGDVSRLMEPSSSVTGAKGEKPRPLSTGQMMHRLQVELASAELNNYPFSLVMVRLDEIEGLDYPRACRSLLPIVVKHMQRLAVDRSKRGLGMMRGPCLITGFPHVKADEAKEIVSELLERLRRVQLPAPHENTQATLSAGIGHNAFTGEITLETLIEDAEMSLRLALSNGGDRCVRWRDVEDEVENLREELDTTIENIKRGSRRREKLEAQWTDEFIQKTVLLFQAEPEQNEGVIRVMNNMITLVDSEVSRLCKLTRQEAPSAGNQDVAMLERRIQKLNESLSRTETELKRVASMKDVDLGVASIYRTVQGLTDDTENAEQKREMLGDIFRANLALRTGE